MLALLDHKIVEYVIIAQSPFKFLSNNQDILASDFITSQPNAV